MVPVAKLLTSDSKSLKLVFTLTGLLGTRSWFTLTENSPRVSLFHMSCYSDTVPVLLYQQLALALFCSYRYGGSACRYRLTHYLHILLTILTSLLQPSLLWPPCVLITKWGGANRQTRQYSTVMFAANSPQLG